MWGLLLIHVCERATGVVLIELIEKQTARYISQLRPLLGNSHTAILNKSKGSHDKNAHASRLYLTGVAAAEPNVNAS